MEICDVVNSKTLLLKLLLKLFHNNRFKNNLAFFNSSFLIFRFMNAKSSEIIATIQLLMVQPINLKTF